MAKAGNAQLGNAKKEKKDEFYTQLSDINAELRHYMHHFAGTVVFCNCDDPYESNFFKYFAANFNALKLKRLIATCYAGSQVAGKQLELFNDAPEPENTKKRIPHKIVINEVKDVNGDGRIDLADVEWLIKNDKNVLTKLEGDGDFRSAECVALLKEADIVVTNPPFSLFREYVAQLIQYGKKFLIIGSVNAISYKEIFPLIMQNRIWLGYGFKAGNAYFAIPEANVRDFANGVYDVTNGLVKFRNCTWFTNLDHKKRHEEFVSVRRYNPDDYPKYVNYDAIEVSRTVDIPEDWDDLMGVPITFLDKYNPDQFEVMGQSLTLADMKVIKNLQGKAGGGPRFYIERDGKLIRLYDRIVIRRKK